MSASAAARPATAAWLLPRLFQSLLARHPGLTFAVTTGLGGALRQLLRDGQLDLVVSPLGADDKREFTCFPVAVDTLVVAARPGHRNCSTPAGRIFAITA